MKILFFARSFYPNIGGVEKHVLEISKLLAEKGHEVTIITENLKEAYSNNYHSVPSSDKNMGKSNKIRIIRIEVGKDDWFKKFRVWKGLLGYRQVIFSSEIVHCHDVFFWYLPFRFLFPKKKVYTTFHGYEGNGLPTKKAVLMHKLSEKLSKGNICVGEFLKKWYGTNPNLVTYGAVSKKFLNVKKSIFNKKDFKNKIIFVGRLEKETGIMTYLKSLKILKEKGLNYKIDIYGEGSLENEIKKYSRLNKISISLNKPRLDIENVQFKYEYIFCSRYLSILEALALKQQVFAEYNNDIKKDYLEMTPFAKYISISKDANEISESFERFTSLNKDSEVNVKAFNWVKDQTWEAMVNNYLTLWKS